MTFKFTEKLLQSWPRAPKSVRQIWIIRQNKSANTDLPDEYRGCKFLVLSFRCLDLGSLELLLFCFVHIKTFNNSFIARSIVGCQSVAQLGCPDPSLKQTAEKHCQYYFPLAQWNCLNINCFMLWHQVAFILINSGYIISLFDNADIISRPEI